MTEKQQLTSIIKRALDQLYLEDEYLIHNGSDDHISERAIVFRFGKYFQQLLNDHGFERYDLDCEYNRNGTHKKQLNGWDKGCSPDIILHKRGNNDSNLLVMEFKGWWNDKQSKDAEKVKKLIDPAGEYKYKYGCTVLFGKQSPEVRWV